MPILQHQKINFFEQFSQILLNFTNKKSDFQWFLLFRIDMFDKFNANFTALFYKVEKSEKKWKKQISSFFENNRFYER